MQVKLYVIYIYFLDYFSNKDNPRLKKQPMTYFSRTKVSQCSPACSHNPISAKYSNSGKQKKTSLDKESILVL